MGTSPQVFFFRRKGPIFLEALDLWVRCRRRLFSSKKAPIFLEALDLWVRCRRRFFFHKKGPIFLEALNLWVRCRRRLFFPEKWPPYFWKPLTCGYVAAGAFFFHKKGPIFLEALLSRTARIHQIWARIIRARHGNPPPPAREERACF